MFASYCILSDLKWGWDVIETIDNAHNENIRYKEMLFFFVFKVTKIVMKISYSEVEQSSWTNARK